MYSLQIAAPEVVIVVVFIRAFDKNQQAGIDRQHGIAGTFCCQVPVVGGGSTIPTGAPGRGIVRFIAQVHADHGGVVLVAGC